MLDTEDVVQRFGPMIRKIVNRSVRSREDRDDVFGQVMCQIHAHRHTYDPARGAASTWVYRVAERTVTEAYRTARRKFRHCPKAVPLDAVGDDLPVRKPRDVLSELEGDAAELASIALSVPAEMARVFWRDVMAAAMGMGWSQRRTLAARKEVQRYLSGRTA